MGYSGEITLLLTLNCVVVAAALPIALFLLSRSVSPLLGGIIDLGFGGFGT